MIRSVFDVIAPYELPPKHHFPWVFYIIVGIFLATIVVLVVQKIKSNASYTEEPEVLPADTDDTSTEE